MLIYVIRVITIGGAFLLRVRSLLLAASTPPYYTLHGESLRGLPPETGVFLLIFSGNVWQSPRQHIMQGEHIMYILV